MLKPSNSGTKMTIRFVITADIAVITQKFRNNSRTKEPWNYVLECITRDWNIEVCVLNNAICPLTYLKRQLLNMVVLLLPSIFSGTAISFVFGDIGMFVNQVTWVRCLDEKYYLNLSAWPGEENVTNMSSQRYSKSSISMIWSYIFSNVDIRLLAKAVDSTDLPRTCFKNFLSNVRNFSFVGMLSKLQKKCLEVLGDPYCNCTSC